MIRVEHGDCREIIPTLGVTVDAVVTDPPYHLQSGNLAVDWSAYTDKGVTNPTGRKAGFMGQQWDGGDIAFRPETWATIGSVLRPGGFLVAFGGTRTYHRLTCAIEDAGFVIQDCLMWLFATGFPKRRDMLKPAYEPIVLAYKPGGKRAMQVDECRVATNGEDMGDPLRFANCKEHPGWDRPSHTPETIAARAVRNIAASTAMGRWPANLCHDGSDEVVAAFPESAGQQGDVRGTEPSEPFGGPIYGHGLHRQQALKIGDSGSAARFFFSAPQSIPCALCGWPCDDFTGTMGACSPVSNAAKSSLQPDTEKTRLGSALNGAPGCIQPENEATPNPKTDPANSAASPSSQCHQTTPGIAPENAPDWPLSKIVQNVRSAAHLCGLCGTAIAQSLAASRQGRAPEPHPGPASISETSKQILSRSLALYVAGRESTDIILTTQSLSELFGSVFHAIADGINSERSVSRVNIGSGQKRLHYSSKASAQDRWGSRHPTVKPVELMKWLVALVCPPGGTVLDCFAGSGTTGVAALATGRNAILIEREAQYHEDIKQRLAFYEGGGSHSVQAKNRNRKTDAGPLFAELAFDEALDCKLSYDAAIQAIGEQVKAGEPLPTGGYFGGEE